MVELHLRLVEFEKVVVSLFLSFVFFPTPPYLLTTASRMWYRPDYTFVLS